jgi:hypothetical protein
MRLGMAGQKLIWRRLGKANLASDGDGRSRDLAGVAGGLSSI